MKEGLVEFLELLQFVNFMLALGVILVLLLAEEFALKLQVASLDGKSLFEQFQTLLLVFFFQLLLFTH